MRHALERHKSYPIAAWALLVFAVCGTLYLIHLLNKEAAGFEQQRALTETALDRDLRKGHIEY